MKNSKLRIDTHVHISRNPKTLFVMKEEWVIEAMKDYDIDFAMVSNGDCAEVDHNQQLMPKEAFVSQEEALKADIEFAAKHSGKIGIYTWIRPLTQGYTKELENIIKQNRKVIYGVKIHPFHSKVAPDDKRVLPYLEMADKLGLAVISHSGGCEEASPEHLYNAAKMFPNVPFVMAHMGLGTDNQEAIKYVKELPNLYGDTTWVSVKSTIQALKECGNEKIFFGSDMPIDGKDTYLANREGKRSLYQEYFNEFHDMVSQEAYDNVMYKNAIRVFGIDKWSEML